MQFKGYTAAVHFDAEAEILHGEVIDIRDVITFQADNVKELKTAFEDSVNDYLEFCKERGEEPDKPFSGIFSVRIDPELHKKVYIASKLQNKSINSWVTETLSLAVQQNKQSSSDLIPCEFQGSTEEINPQLMYDLVSIILKHPIIQARGFPQSTSGTSWVTSSSLRQVIYPPSHPFQSFHSSSLSKEIEDIL